MSRLVGRTRALSARLGSPRRLDAGAPAARRLSGAAGEGEAQLRKDLATAHRLAAHYKLHDEIVWGHISARISHEKDDFLITPGDRHFSLMRPEHLVRAKDIVNATGDVIHGAIMNSRPDVQAVMHCHSDAHVFVSCLDRLELLTQDGLPFHGKVGYHDFEGVACDPGESARIAEDLGPTNHTLILRNHGVVTTGESVQQAWVRMFYLDLVCRAQMRLATAKAAGMPLGQEMSPAFLEEHAKVYDTEGFRHGEDVEWRALNEFAQAFLGCSWIEDAELPRP